MGCWNTYMPDNWMCNVAGIFVIRDLQKVSSVARMYNTEYTLAFIFV